ncbi:MULTISPECIES: bifunctional pyr operon transcriptional regulator/uracil phosphoribosyltransferase PyrR [Pseudomonas]|uniref:Bifunctional pyr operon transcriptional regulator/uracil phosphoribosyltransferase PyrR n=1 Tax=Pseudomonas neustonica TaxID=2487346 RepID=A0ABX9XLX6_9PSED|nr:MULTISPECIES: bifunctional pyr operon transcriptional regulator/uracil phosphoribosyltransferase PyrR [Pseudomonas]MBA6419081.1 bifunctional pyr operon transcriptional regulator/uracil phosphoribosyltransferase PyrR [Pseudomonas sp. 5Ae-yellow]ROZ86204.1 bifunctional pyr operon transcriptional regulator/uracil phosphoribosyltransferase PyrR [Pseudomonas sp. SSM44]ROZ87929.1 bifunctional pyr operon transcriptional regulator/uracil phosphoribosyltransferase PyrR [Pseudomonas neustonica]|tara:strand:+ start:421 stop:930 length:510 start_codon:yes stop_codon:yes gene_type:complete
MSALPEVGPLLQQMADQLSRYLQERQIDDPAFVGIHTGGVWIAEALHQQVAPNAPMGTLDIAFYRDDFEQHGLPQRVRPSELPFTVDGRHLILVDDVLMTGRTIRAALNELFDYGRPASVTLVTLLDIEARQLPVRADILGASLALPAGQRVKLTGPSPLQLTLNAATH